MKKSIFFLLVLIIAATFVSCSGEVDLSEIKTGYLVGAPHGHYAFAVTTVTMSGDVILSAMIDEFQFQDADSGMTGVPNSDESFGTNVIEGKVLVSKRVNNDGYSANMATKAGSTVKIADNYNFIQDYVAGKTVAELEKLAAMAPEEVVDAISGATLADSQGYIKSIIAAAKIAK